MINEGYVLYNSLKRCGITLMNRHPQLAEPGRKEGLIVGLNKRGEVESLEYRNAGEIAKLWTTREGKHNSFPVLKLQRPLWKISKNDLFRKSKQDETEKRKLLFKKGYSLNVTGVENNWWVRLRERVKTLQDYFQSDDREFAALDELLKRFLLIEKVEWFLNSLLEKLESSHHDVKYSLLETIMIGNKWDRKKNEYRAEAPLVLDVSDWEKYSVRVASPKMEPFVSKSLFKMHENESEPNAMQMSALSGTNVQVEDQKFPSPKLPVVGETYLFAVNKDTPCQTRYGKTSTEIIPIGRSEAIAIQNSLDWTTADERKGRTWYPVPGLQEGKNDLLIVYLEDKPDAIVNKAHMMGGQTANAFTESNYEAVSSIAIDSLRAKKIIKANELLRLFALRKADPGRTQVSLQRTYTIGDLVRSDKLWREASANTPIISIPFFRKEVERVAVKQGNLSRILTEFLKNEQEKVIYLSPQCPFPADIVRVTQREWIRFGQGSTSVSGISLGDVYDVFFAQPNERQSLIIDLLSLTLQRTQSLLIGLGEADHKRKTTGFGTDARFIALTTVSAIAIYLHKLGIRKEHYMKDTFFYVGRFLSLIDTLHFEWCKYVRGGYPKAGWDRAIPPQLLGNAHMNIALDNPISAFDILSRRLSIYQAWTKKEQGEHMKLAWWAVGQLGNISSLLAERALPSSTTSVERAQILLGYLAKSDKDDKEQPQQDLSSDNQHNT